MYSGALDAYKNPHTYGPDFRNLNQNNYSLKTQKITRLFEPCIINSYTYTHFGLGDPQSAQCRFPERHKRLSSLLMGPKKIRNSLNSGKKKAFPWETLIINNAVQFILMINDAWRKDDAPIQKETEAHVYRKYLHLCYNDVDHVGSSWSLIPLYPLLAMEQMPCSKYHPWQISIEVPAGH